VSDKVIGSVLVLGGGIAGMQSAQDLANGGFLVHLVTDEPSIGGKMAQLDKTFPTNECAMCLLGPKMSDTLSHPNIRIHTCSKLSKVEGEAGNFKVSVEHAARYVNIDECTACGDCEQVCPVKVKDKFNEEMGERKAIYKLFPQSVPNKYLIEKRGEPPCRNTCPAGCNAQGYTALISEGRFGEALEVVRRRMPFAGICGRICHHPCEAQCNRKEIDEPISIALLKRAAADFGWQDAEDKGLLVNRPAETVPFKVAIIGAGPGGLAAAKDLAELGYKVTVLDTLPKPGGMLIGGIPRYRLPEEIVNRETQAILDLGVEFRGNTKVGVDITFAELQTEFDAVLLAVGLQKGRSLPIPGTDLQGVHLGVEFLREAALGGKPRVGKKTIVIGGGNVAIDTARTALRLGSTQVHLFCLEDYNFMPAHAWEVLEAEEEGLIVHPSWGPQEILGKDGWVEGISFKKCTSVFDVQGRFNPSYDEGNVETVFADCIILSIGQGSELTFLDNSGIEHERGIIKVNKLTAQTNLAKIFACGDVVNGPTSVVEAVAGAHAAAESIHRLLHDQDLSFGRTLDKPNSVGVPEGRLYTATQRENQRVADHFNRSKDFTEVCKGFTEAQAIREAERCLNCGICSECLQCVKACKKNAICHEALSQTVEIEVGAVILTPGYQLEPGDLRGEYGYGYYPNVVTSMEFERILSSTGPYQGHVIRPSDHKAPKKVAFIQCVGSRTCGKGVDYCSSICCMYSTKEATISREHDANIEPTIFYLDMRSYGKNFDKYVKAAKNNGVRYVRTMISSVKEDPTTGNLILRYNQGAQTIEEEFELVVLAMGVKPPKDALEIARVTGIKTNEYDFAYTNPLNPVETSKRGVFVAGAFQGPRDIPETVMNASAAAAAAGGLLAAGRNSLVTPKVYPLERDVSGEEPRVGVFICRCGINIASIVDVPRVLEYAKGLANVVRAEEFLYTCSQDTVKHIKDVIVEEKLNRVVVASCTIRTHQPLFREALREAGLNQFLFEMANIRDQCSWVHRSEPYLATIKAKDLVRMAVAKVKYHAPLQMKPVPVVPAGLVIGGGISGMTACLTLAEQGFKSYCVERESVLGGNLQSLYFGEDGGDAQEFLLQTIEQVSGNPLIQVLTNTEILDFTGHQGHFITTLKVGEEKQEIHHGVVIVATGGKLAEPNAVYGWGQDARIMTLVELEEKLHVIDQMHKGDPLSAYQQSLGQWQSAAFILCASAGQEMPYCSRSCCTQSITNAIRLKQQNPEGQVYILHRDIRTYGFLESYYRLAREMGILFVRYSGDDLPVPDLGNKLLLEVKDMDSDITFAITPDILVLAQGFEPATAAKELGTMLKVPLNEDGFYMETHAKLGPMDFPGSGLFLCGAAHSPKFVSEAIYQAQGAVARAVTILSKPNLMVGGVVAKVTPEKCAACLTCVRVCPYNVPKIGPDMVAEIEAVQCHGCGTCVGECPAKAIQLQHYTDEQMLAKITAVGEVE
jgi:heterodisulfide reductase subunit A-like polyferredoxin